MLYLGFNENNENNKIIRENKGKIIKQNEFQQFVIVNNNLNLMNL